MRAIVKVQVPLLSIGGPAPGCLIYAKGRHGTVHQELSENVLKEMNGAPKAYFEAVFRDGSWILGRRVKDQKW